MPTLPLNNGDVAFMVITTVLVFLMTPGLAFFYGGLVEKKNAITIMMYSFLSVGVVTVMWTLGGFSLVFGPDIAGVIGNPASYFMLKGMDFSVNPAYGSKIPFLMFFMYQLMFAIITAPLMTGAFANRMTLTGWMKLLVLWMLFIYFPVAHWVWGQGFLAKWGFVDYAGGTVIHATAGFGALAAILYLGKRAVISSSAPGNIAYVSVGGALLMFGWFGFSSGGALCSGQTAAIAFTNTGIAAGFALLAWVLLSYRQSGKISMVELITGAVAGLATITPASGYVTPQGAAIIGTASAFICSYFLAFAKKRGWDDALGVWGVHGMGGFCGTLFIGILADKQVNGVEASFAQFFIQLGGVVLCSLYAFLLTWLALKIADKTGSIRVDEKTQQQGLDQALVGEQFSQEK